MNYTRQQVKAYIKSAIQAKTGDDLERARAAFRSFTPEQMQEQHGRSGRTRQQILDTYEEERKLAMAALLFTEKQ